MVLLHPKIDFLDHGGDCWTPWGPMAAFSVSAGKIAALFLGERACARGPAPRPEVIRKQTQEATASATRKDAALDPPPKLADVAPMQ